MRRNLFLLAVAVTACGPTKEQQVAVATQKIAAESTKAAAVAALPQTGKWDEPHLAERLVRSGLAPQAVTDAKHESFWTVPGYSWKLNDATLYAYVFPDSVARRKVTDALDTLTLAPKGQASPYFVPRLLILQNNLAAVLVGGSERQQERVQLALMAGLPVGN
jgi:hypothetical protein